jgi:Fe-S cluster assembly protein SufD
MDAWERFGAASFPTEAEEVWRYSGIDRFDLDAFGPTVASSGDGLDKTALERAEFLAQSLGRRSALVVTRNGVLSGVVMDGSAPDSLTIRAARDRAEDFDPPLGELARANDAFGDLHDAFVADALIVRVARRGVVTDPVVIVHLVDTVESAGNGARGTSAFPRTVVSVEGSAEAGAIEIVAPLDPTTRSSRAVRPTLVLPVAELHVADDARLRYASVQVLDGDATVITTQASRVGRDAGLLSFTAGLGGRYARVRTDSDLVGPGGHTSLLAAYLGTGDQIHDFRTLQDHHAGRTDSELLFKGAVADTARSVYSGLIRIRKGARGADARQTNHNLVLSEGAHADSVPNLDIDENDVRCSHASTVGPIDEEQRYYLETRGIDPATSERLIVTGFFSDLARRAPFAGVGQWVEDAVQQRLSTVLPATPDIGGEADG